MTTYISSRLRKDHTAAENRKTPLSLFSMFMGGNVYMALKMPDACVSHAFGQSVYTYVTDSSHISGLDHTLKQELI